MLLPVPVYHTVGSAGFTRGIGSHKEQVWRIKGRLFPFRNDKTIDDPKRLAKMADGLPRPGCGIVLALEVRLTPHHVGGIGFVYHEKITFLPEGPVPVSHTESGNTHPFRHVFAIMPFEIFGLIVLIDIGPKGQQSLRFPMCHRFTSSGAFRERTLYFFLS